jgi:hypothetical protein
MLGLCDLAICRRKTTIDLFSFMGADFLLNHIDTVIPFLLLLLLLSFELNCYYVVLVT